MNNIYDINLPIANKYLISKLIKMGAGYSKIENTGIYLVKFRGKEFLFKGEFNPAIPYMYGVVLSSKYYWSQILKQLGVHEKKIHFLKKDKLTIFITENHSYNIVLHGKIKLEGDGKRTLSELIEEENLKRINKKDKTIFPINIDSSNKNLDAIIPKNKKVLIPNNSEYIDVSGMADKKYTDIARKLINFFPRLPFISFELYTKDFSKNGDYYVGDVMLSGGINLFFKLNGKKTKRNAADETINYLL